MGLSEIANLLDGVSPTQGASGRSPPHSPLLVPSQLTLVLKEQTGE